MIQFFFFFSLESYRELVIKQNLAKDDSIDDIDAEFIKNEDSKSNRRRNSKKSLGPDYVSGGGLSKSSETSDPGDDGDTDGNSSDCTPPPESGLISKFTLARGFCILLN